MLTKNVTNDTIGVYKMYTTIYKVYTINLERTPVSFGPGVFLLLGDVMTKIFKSHDEQVDLLIGRGLSVKTSENRANVKRCLQRTGYYKLINGYKILFLDRTDPAGPEKFIEGTTIEQINALFTFDKELRGILLDNILTVETNIKTLIAYEFSEKYGHDNYLIYKNFNQKKQALQITNLIADIQKQISQRVSDPSISHYLTKYGYVPLWVLNNILTLGTVSKFYSLMKIDERQNISRIFHLQDHELESILFYISAVRNFCAHGNRVYCYRSKRPLVSLKFHKDLGIKKERDEFSYGKRDLFAVLIALKPIMSRNQFTRMIRKLEQSIKRLNKNLTVISTDDVLSIMGFPHNWKELSNKFK